MNLCLKRFWKSSLRQTGHECKLVWLYWSRMKRGILIGSLNGPNFAIGTAKMDHSRSDFTDLCSLKDI